MKKAAIYARVSTADQHVETQLYDLRKLATQRGFEVVKEHCDRGFSGSKARRPGLDSLLGMPVAASSLRLVAAFDRIARSTKNFSKSWTNSTNSGSNSCLRERQSTPMAPMGRMFITLVGSIAELERSLITERIRAGMRRARLEGQRLGRAPLNIDHDALVRDRLAGMSLTRAGKEIPGQPCKRPSALSGKQSGVRWSSAHDLRLWNFPHMIQQAACASLSP